MMISPTVLAADSSAAALGSIAGCCLCSPLFWWLMWRYFFQEMIEEWRRGHKRGQTDEEILDELPKKKVVVFKGEKVPDWKIAGRSKATKSICKFLSYTDNWFERKYLADAAEEAFRLVKEAVEERSLQGIERRVTDDLLEDLRGEIKELKKDRKIHVFGRVDVTDVNVVHVEAPTGKENHTFTALITWKSCDFMEDDETGEVLNNDKNTYIMQEFWSFRRSEKRWLVELIRPSSDLDNILESKNVMATIDLEEFAKEANADFLKEVVPR